MLNANLKIHFACSTKKYLTVTATTVAITAVETIAMFATTATVATAVATIARAVENFSNSRGRRILTDNGCNGVAVGYNRRFAGVVGNV